MPHHAQVERRQNYVFAGLLCVLVVLFAIGAKVALYQPGQADKPIAATKLWESTPDLLVQATPPLPATSLLVFATFALSFAIARVSFLSAEQVAPPLQSWFSPYLSIRPPPSL